MHVAFELEAQFPKDKILELYLNQINLGNGAFGVEAAAQRYFGKSARDLNVAEAATLAGIPRSPTRYNPRRNPDLSVERRNLILDLMADEGVLSRADAERWKSYPLLLSSRSDFSEVAPYFIEYVRQQLRTRFGSELYRGGLRIYTTVDLDIQQAAERAMLRQLEDIERNKTVRQVSPAELRGLPGEARRRRGVAGAVALPAGPGGGARGAGPARSWRWWAGGTSTTASSTARSRRSGSRAPPSSRSSTPRRSGAGHSLVRDRGGRSRSAWRCCPGEPPWEPQNYDNRFDGPMSLKQAFFKSQQHPRDQARHGDRAPGGDRRGGALRHPDAGAAPIPSIYIGSADVIRSS